MGMKTILKAAIAMAVASVCASASAGIAVVTFETLDPGIYSGGDVLEAGPQRITVRGENMFDGAVINGRDPSSCDVAVCPSGNNTNYYAALNDGGFSFGMANQAAFGLQSIDFGFILPVNTLVGFSVGKLILTTNDGATASKDFGLQDGNGKYNFSRWDFGSDFAPARFTEATFQACLYDGTGACVNPANYQAQFAVDNLTYVPEPGSLSLVGLSLAGMLAAYRRRRSA
jgi:hypothetical protein